jgi:hypothetical protein
MQYLFSASIALATVRIGKPTEHFRIYRCSASGHEQVGEAWKEREELHFSTYGANDYYTKRFPVTIPRQNNFNRDRQ